MKTITVNLALKDTQLAQIDEEARRESRTRSELIREATRRYIDTQRKWNELFKLGDAIRSGRRLKEKDIVREIEASRREYKGGKAGAGR